MDVLINVLTTLLILIVLFFAGYALYISDAVRFLFNRRKQHTEEGYDDDT